VNRHINTAFQKGRVNLTGKKPFSAGGSMPLSRLRSKAAAISACATASRLSRVPIRIRTVPQSLPDF
jgi:hypothetical protein